MLHTALKLAMSSFLKLKKPFACPQSKVSLCPLLSGHLCLSPAVCPAHLYPPLATFSHLQGQKVDTGPLAGLRIMAKSQLKIREIRQCSEIVLAVMCSLGLDSSPSSHSTGSLLTTATVQSHSFKLLQRALGEGRGWGEVVEKRTFKLYY